MYLGTHSTDLECLLLFAILSLSGLGINFSILLDTSAMIRAQFVESMTHLVVLVVALNLLILEVILVTQSFTGKVVDGTWDDLLFEVLSELVVDLESLIKVFKSLLVDFLVFELLGGRWLRWLEEAEERVGGDGLADNTCSAGG